MESKDLVEFVKELVGVPYYYTDTEKNFSISLSIIAAIVGFLVVRRLVRQSTWIIIVVACLFVVSALIYTSLLETGGVFFYQTACRIIVMLTFTFLIPYEEGADAADD